MWIDVKIPYEPNEKLAYAYNRAIKGSTAPWVLLLDHDVFLGLNPEWYNICLKAIKDTESVSMSNVVLFTCTTNGNSDRVQCPVVSIDKTSDLNVHVAKAKKARVIARLKREEITDKYIAGCFMLVKRTYVEDYPFKDQGKGVNKVDQAFMQEILDNGYRGMVLKSLYVYHMKGVRKWK